MLSALNSPLLHTHDHLIRSPRIRHQELHAQVASTPIEIINIINEQEKKNFKLGIILIMIAIAAWMVGLELVNTVLKGDEYTKPFLLSVITGSCFSFNFVPEVFDFFKTLLGYNNDVPVLPASYNSISNEDLNKNARLRQNLNHNLLDPPHIVNSNTFKSELDDDSPEQLTFKEIIVLALQVTLIYYVYNVMGMSSLRFTSASNQTVLGSTTAIFTLFIGVCLKIDKFTNKKLCCVIVSLLGVVLINYSQISQDQKTNDDKKDKFQSKNPALGNTLALLAAFCYSLYLIIMKVKCGSGNKTTNERILFGYVGVFTILFGIPVIIVIDYLGIEKFEFPPPTNKILAIILINSFFSYISDFVTILAMLLTSPLITSLSLTSSIPITIFIDYLIIHITGADSQSSNLYLYTIGILSILVSVILINVNIFNENDFIEEIIEDTFENAIRNDEILSPVLSPLLDTHSHLNSPNIDNLNIGFSTSSLLTSFSPNLFSVQHPQTKVSNSQSTPLLTRRVSGFNLNQSPANAQPPTNNENHNDALYSNTSRQTEDLTQTEILVYGGVNHHYHVKHLDGNNSSGSALPPRSPPL